MVLTQQEQLLSKDEQLASRDTEIEHLKLLIAKLRRMQFGRSSEKLDRQIEQLELRLEELQTSQAENKCRQRCCKTEHRSNRLPAPLCGGRCRSTCRAKRGSTCQNKTVPGLRRNTETTRRRRIGNPGVRAGALQSNSADSSRSWPARVAIASCKRQHRVGRSSAASLVPGLLAHVLVSKYGDHLPLYRQSEIYAREGVELDRSTLADWVGGTSRLLAPLVEALRRHVMAGNKIHGDDTPVPVLGAGPRKNKNGTAVDVCA